LLDLRLGHWLIPDRLTTGMERDAYDDAHYDVRIEMPRDARHPRCEEIAEALRHAEGVPPLVQVSVKLILPVAG